MALATLKVDSAASATLSTTAVIPVLNGAVTGTGDALLAMVTLADLSTFFLTIDGPFTTTTATATPSAYTATTFTGLASTVSGATLMGYGTTGDVTLKNRAGTDVLVVTANTTGVTLAGALAIVGALSGVTTLAVSTSATVTSASAVALAVGLAGATNPSFVVDSATASQAAGLKVTGATAAGVVAAAVISSGAAASLTIDAKGTGTIGIGTVSTGSIQLGVAAGVTQVLVGGSGYGAGVASLRMNGLTTATEVGLSGTLLNSPVTGNPTFWMPVSIAGTIKYIPCW